MTFELILDLVIVALLVPTIVYAVILNNRLSVLRKNRDDLARLVSAFNEATVRAESGIPRLRKTSEDAARNLGEQVERAQTLRDDLAFMVERAESMANRLEGAVRQARGEVNKTPPTPAAMDIESAAAVAERVKARFSDETRPERRADGGGLSAEAARSGTVAASRPQPRTAAGAGQRPARSLGAALAGESGATTAGSGPSSFDDDRSEAERELLRALQSAR